MAPFFASFLPSFPPSLLPFFFTAFEACHLEPSLVGQLNFAAGFIPLAFQVGLRQHLQFLEGTHHQRLPQRGR